MGDGASDIKGMVATALVTISLAVSTLMGIAILTQFKETGLVDNATADNFITGLGIFGTFMSIITLGVVVKIVIALVR